MKIYIEKTDSYVIEVTNEEYENLKNLDSCEVEDFLEEKINSGEAQWKNGGIEYERSI